MPRYMQMIEQDPYCDQDGRLRWRCRRGMRELDQLLTGYLDSRYTIANETEKAAFRGLLELPDPELFRLPSLMRWNALRVETAGSIGLRLTWDDGHDAGIYTWERLRAMCPCPECSPV